MVVTAATLTYRGIFEMLLRDITIYVHAPELPANLTLLHT
jgi:hypothetical protein